MCVLTLQSHNGEGENPKPTVAATTKENVTFLPPRTLKKKGVAAGIRRFLGSAERLTLPKPS
jgi:hypothetical protein